MTLLNQCQMLDAYLISVKNYEGKKSAFRFHGNGSHLGFHVTCTGNFTTAAVKSCTPIV